MSEKVLTEAVERLEAEVQRRALTCAQDIIDNPSPNHSARKAGGRVDTIVIHHTGTDALGRWSDGSALNTLTNPTSGVSAHYTVTTDGKVYRHVPEHLKAWHAGKGRLPWEKGPFPHHDGYDFNHRSIGIEVVNPGDGKTPFTGAQYRALAWLVPDIVRRLGGVQSVVVGWTPTNHAFIREAMLARDVVWILGHRDVAPGRKTDPADNFDWARIGEALAGGVA